MFQESKPGVSLRVQFSKDPASTGTDTESSLAFLLTTKRQIPIAGGWFEAVHMQGPHDLMT